MTTSALPIDIPHGALGSFCRRHHIRRLSLFGSVIHDDFLPESDIDVLVEFKPEARVGFMTLAGLEIELEKIIGRKIDMHTPTSLSPYFRDQVIQEARIQYEQA